MLAVSGLTINLQMHCINLPKSNDSMTGATGCQQKFRAYQGMRSITRFARMPGAHDVRSGFLQFCVRSTRLLPPRTRRSAVPEREVFRSPVMHPALQARFPLDSATTPPKRFLISVASRTFTPLPSLGDEGGSVRACPPGLNQSARRRAYLNSASAVACGITSLSR